MSLFAGAVQRTLKAAIDLVRGAHRTVWDWGAIGDCVVFHDGSISSTANPNRLTVAGASFSDEDVGKAVWIHGAGPSGSGLLSTIASRISATQVTLANAASTTVTGAWGRYGTDNSDAIEAAVAAISNSRRRGGRLHFPRGGYLTTRLIDLSACKAGFRVSGESWCSVSAYGNVATDVDNASVIYCCAPDPVFRVEGASYSDARFCLNVDRITLSGIPEPGSMGLEMIFASDAHLEHVMFDVFGDHALKITSSINFTADHCMAQNSMMVHAGRSAYVGVFDVDATDCFITRCNLNADFNIATDTPSVSGWIASLVIRTANGWVRDCMLAQGEVGLAAINAAPLKLSQVRCDINRRAGFVIQSRQVQANGCLAFRNSRDSDGGYPGFLIEEGQNTFTDCMVVNLDQDNPGNPSPFSPARRQSYGFRDTSNLGASFNLHNRFVNCRAVEVKDGTYDFAGATNKVLHVEYQPSAGEAHPDSPAKFLRWQSVDGFFGLLKSTTVPYAGMHIERDDASDLLRLESGTAAAMLVSTAAPVNKKTWKRYLNAGAGFSELIESVVNDAQTLAAQWLKVKQNIGSGSPTIEEVVFPAPIHAESTARVDGITTMRPSVTVGGKILSMHSAGIGIYACNGDPNSQIGSSGVVAGSLALQAGANVMWLFLDSGAWQAIYPGRELPQESGSTNKKYLRSNGSDGSRTWEWVNTESLRGVNDGRYLRVGATNLVDEVIRETVAVDLRNNTNKFQHHHFVSVNEPTGSTSSDGTPSHSHSVGTSVQSHESGDELWTEA